MKIYLLENVNENGDLKKRIICVKDQLFTLLKSHEENDKYDDEWFTIRQELRKIEGYIKDGYFQMNGSEFNAEMKNFVDGLDYSNTHTYKRGNIAIHKFPELDKNLFKGSTSNISNIWEAKGSKILFRGVSLKDWERIQSQGYIDSDMRGAISAYEGINLAQNPSTAFNYLPVNDEGIVLAISPQNLDLYIMQDEYIRVFDSIPFENIKKISPVYLKNDMGALLSTNIMFHFNEILKILKNHNINLNC